MADNVAGEFVNVPHSIRTALAYIDQHGAGGALARITREEAGYTRTWHRALKLLRELQNEKKPNEPKPGLNLVVSTAKGDASSPARAGGSHAARPTRDETLLPGPAACVAAPDAQIAPHYPGTSPVD